MAETALYIDSTESKNNYLGRFEEVVREQGAALLEFDDIDEMLRCLRQPDLNGSTPCLTLIGTDLGNPIQTARKIRSVIPEMHFVFLETTDNLLLKQELQSPVSGVGNHWEILKVTSDYFSSMLSRSLGAAIKRKKFKTTIVGLQNKILVSEKPKVSELQRYSVSLRFLSNLFEYAHDAIIATTCEGTIVKWNNAAQSLFGLSVDTAVGRSIFKIAGGNWSQELKGLVNLLLKGDSEHMEKEVEFSRPEEQTVYVNLMLSVIRGNENEAIGLSATIRDITEQKIAQKVLDDMRRNLERMSYEDGLTGVANRRMFDVTLEKEWRRMRRNRLPLSLILIDIDYFKAYNDLYGHQKGDKCLKLVAQALMGCVSRSSDLVARYGGEEFAILLPDIELDEAKEIAARCCLEVRELNLLHEASKAERHITISAGLTCVVPNEERYKDFVSMADRLLYQAKKMGRNRVCSE
ncbi:hypothetical protein BTA51_29395 [Hahella sp. CCB-MM4]|uniref:sensor domain-containing diguanylate cyclase n=1 Tax=Hahella sp. (strain CCB-MM4) TaxID=1926491 RepID=UPI000B9AADAC|nr:sensor domain-containing diguanylate cyclase [Hahella sp. CCB-MM4]OZG69741.1 hypothetical protein BTA51_29395 [Hahella sp. CCB-MM4]